LLKVIDGWIRPLARWHHLDPLLTDPSVQPSVYEVLGPRPTLALYEAIEESLAGNVFGGFLPKKWEFGKDQNTIEHIYPQDGSQWGASLKKARVQEIEMRNRLHMLGNLTVLEGSLNKKIKNKSFDQKVKTINTNTTAANLKLQTWLNSPTWGPKEIDDRTKQIINILKNRWPDPIDS
jgi:hypothetical protein